MIDFETLGTQEDAVVLSVGAIVFILDKPELDKLYYKEYLIASQIAKGRTVDKGTVQWWLRVNPLEFNRLCIGDKSADLIGEVLKFSVANVWSRGCMDFHILQHLTGNHYAYNQHRDVRTLDIFGKRMGKNKHNALEDSKNQLEYVRKILYDTKVL